MKVRNGFVSNSSSSSFLISFSAGTDLEKLFKNRRDGRDRYGDETHIKCIDEEEILEWIKNNIFDLNYDYNLDPLNNWKEYRNRNAHRFMVLAQDIAKEIKEGKDVAVITVDYHDTESYDNLNSNGIKIIRDWD